ncbi:TonB-dependent receptor [Alteromonas sediminis]|uniref:TonB-dependent receptor n=1 Tax=Alteromonas sediminis TaxID=2259342 RepID=A0A3N5Y2P2_9ALTE|nr:TonB-dependent receptor [Alteromonas sediminis]RPJ67580.1 TonB-dependent receptor [Alteromonas sediminis]
MSQFKKNVLAFSVSAALTGLGTTVAIAQDNADAAAEVTEVIQVTGIRGALQRAQAIKMEQTSIVEALSAEDIGKLPDTSVAESLARLPGLAGERRNGRTSGLSVRGFNENYVATSLNGRELLGMGDNRGVEFDLYPTEIVSNILVYKTSEAGLLAQGIGGTIDLQTVKPLNAESSFTVNGNIEKNQRDAGNPDYDNQGHRVSLNFVDQFADDQLGLALTVASMESPRQEQQFRAWGDGDWAQDGDGNYILGGHDSFTRSAMMERDSVAAVVQYSPREDLMIQLDALYIDYVENDARRGLEEGLAWGGPTTTVAVEDGFVTEGYTDGFYSVIRNDIRSQESELTTVALNVEYNINDYWSAIFDYSSGKVDKTITDVESYSGTGRAGIDGRPLPARSWTMNGGLPTFGPHPNASAFPAVDLTDPSIISLAGPQPWGASLAPVAQFQGNPNFGPETAQDGFVNQPIFDEELNTTRLELEGLVEWGIFSKLNVGVNYSDRSKTKINGGAYLTSPKWPDADGIPNVLGVADLSWLGLEGVLAYDSLALYNSGYYISTDAQDLETGRLADTYTIEEELLTVFAKLEIDTEIGDMFVRGNVGVQFIDSEQKASGFSVVTAESLYVDATPVTDGDDYTDILPSLNLSFEVVENQFLRVGASKILSRPRMDDMKPNNNASFNFAAGSQFLWSGDAGNARLKPLEATQYDLSYENYFSDDGYIAISYFYKKLTNWHGDGKTLTNFEDLYIPGYHGIRDTNGDLIPLTSPEQFLGEISFKEDGAKGSVEGLEIQGSLQLSEIHDVLEGFGVFASATFLDGELEFSDGGTGFVPGLSEETYSVTFYYENAGWEFRVAGTKRDEFSTETRGLSLALAETRGAGATLVDAQIGYDFSESNIEWLEGLRVTLQGQNLTDEEDVTFANGDPRQIVTSQTFGRNFLLGFNYSF